MDGRIFLAHVTGNVRAVMVSVGREEREGSRDLLEPTVMAQALREGMGWDGAVKIKWAVNTTRVSLKREKAKKKEGKEQAPRHYWRGLQN
jgi:hypothetical protein